MAVTETLFARFAVVSTHNHFITAIKKICIKCHRGDKSLAKLLADFRPTRRSRDTFSQILRQRHMTAYHAHASYPLSPFLLFYCTGCRRLRRAFRKRRGKIPKEGCGCSDEGTYRKKCPKNIQKCKIYEKYD